MRSHFRRPRAPDTGASYIEYGAVALVISGIVVVLLQTGFAEEQGRNIASYIEKAFSGESIEASDTPADSPGAPDQPDSPGVPEQPEGGPGPDVTTADNTLDDDSLVVTPAVYEGPGPGVVTTAASADGAPPGLEDPNDLDQDRRDSGRDAAEQRERDTNRRGDDTGQDTPHIPGDENSENGLGEPEEGEEVEVPDPPPWQPVDEGAGEHGSDGWPVDDYVTKAAAEAAAHAMSGAWPDASRNLLHFMGNSGEPLEQDVDQMLEDVPSFETAVDEQRQNLGETAISQAQESGADGPVTFPVNTGWEGHYIGGSEDKNWFLATGGMQYNLNGSVTVHPPEEEGGEWTYTMTTEVNYRDQYNWDGDKSTDIAPGVNVSDETLAEMHRAGVAQEFPMYGTSESTTTEGP